MSVPRTILHIPHSSAEVPADVRAQLLLEDDDLVGELRLMTDWYTDELFALPAAEAVTVRFPVSRLVVDPERFEDPEAERMEAVGMGAVRRLRVHGAHPDGFHPLRRRVFEALSVDDQAADREAHGDGLVGPQGEELVGVPVGHEPQLGGEVVIPEEELRTHVRRHFG